MTLQEELYASIEEIIGHSEVLLNETDGPLSEPQRNDIYAMLVDAEQFRNIVAAVSDDDLPAYAGDMATLLMNITGFSQLMLDYPEAYQNVVLNDMQHARIQSIDEHGRYLRQLIDQL